MGRGREVGGRGGWGLVGVGGRAVGEGRGGWGGGGGGVTFMTNNGLRAHTIFLVVRIPPSKQYKGSYFFAFSYFRLEACIFIRIGLRTFVISYLFNLVEKGCRTKTINRCVNSEFKQQGNSQEGGQCGPCPSPSPTKERN